MVGPNHDKRNIRGDAVREGCTDDPKVTPRDDSDTGGKQALLPGAREQIHSPVRPGNVRAPSWRRMFEGCMKSGRFLVVPSRVQSCAAEREPPTISPVSRSEASRAKALHERGGYERSE